MKVLGKRFKGFALVTTLAACLSSYAAASVDPKVQSFDFISNGDRIQLRGGDFTIVPPIGWEVFTKHPSLTLLMQIPHEASLKYQRTIQVASFVGKKFIDDVTARDFEAIIVSKFSQLTASIQNYEIREHRIVDMADGRNGILFYTDFNLEGITMMQAHILVSSEIRHYLLTYTDLREHFENEEFSQYLNEAWTAMISAELAGALGSTVLSSIGLAKYQRFQTIIFLGFVTVGVVLFWFVFNLIRKKYAGERFTSYREGNDQADSDPLAPTNLQSMKAVAEGHSVSSSPATQPLARAQSLSKAPETTFMTQHETHYEVAEAAEMEDFFADDDEEQDKAI